MIFAINRHISYNKNNANIYSQKPQKKNKNISFGTNIISEVDRIARSTNAKQNAINSLQDYISLIRDEKLKILCNRILKDTPNPFFIVPSSTSGKYHNTDENKIGGIILHLKKVVVTALSSLRRYGYEYGLEKSPLELKFVDSTITASLLHDCPYRLIQDNGKYFTDSDHAVKNAKYIESVMQEMKFNKKDTDLISASVGFHMGIWDMHIDKSWLEKFKNFRKNPMIQIVQEADYYSTRRNMNINYNLDEIDIRKSFIK